MVKDLELIIIIMVVLVGDWFFYGLIYVGLIGIIEFYCYYN